MGTVAEATLRRPLLVVVTGPTASGKTELAIRLAERYGCDIISADSRQIYRGIPIGTAWPSSAQLGRVRHHFIGYLELHEYYSAAMFEIDVMELLPKLWEKSPIQIMCGGSMMYIDAVVNGIDELPTVSPEVRQMATDLLKEHGLEAVIDRLRDLDPNYLTSADMSNHRRLVHALEISVEAGVPYSTLRTGMRRQRPFDILKAAPDWSREQLFDRINRRVDNMVEQGLIEEARNVYHLRHLNSLNTVGYKELFACFDGSMDLDTAIARIAKNTRVYAKKQLTWLKRANDTTMIPHDHAYDTIIKLIDNHL